jgi:hypothetical protein
MTRLCSWIAQHRRAVNVPNEATAEADQHLARLRAQQAEIDRLAHEARVSLETNHFRLRVEAALRGVDLP